MRTVSRLLPLGLLWILAAGPPALAGTPTRWDGTCAISFAGTSTLHRWAGTVKAEPFVATVDMSDSGDPIQFSADVSVKAAQMDTRNEKRDAKMRESMKTGEFPAIRGRFEKTPFATLKPDASGRPSRLPFQLQLLGRWQPVEAVISQWRASGNEVSFDADFDLSLSRSGIKVPSVLAVIRVGDQVSVHTSVRLVRSN